MQLRQALFFAAASVAGAFSGLLAFAIAKMDGVGGLAGWRWIFILEGIATVICAVFAFWGLYDYPETASFLSDDEREFVIYRLRYQGGMSGASSEDVETRVPEDQEFKWVYVRQAFGGFQVWIMIIAYWAVSILVLPSPLTTTKGW
jgi:MFS family permease